MTTTRWPIHPQPVEGEALTSWLTRIAYCFDLTLTELIAHGLDLPGAMQANEFTVADLDGAPSEMVLSLLSEHTGVSPERLRLATFSGWVPWLLDSMTVDGEDTEAFDTYVRQHSVLLKPEWAPIRVVRNWRPWMSPGPLRRACPVCQAHADPGLGLMSQIPLMLSCPHHQCLLEPYYGVPGSFGHWEAGNDVQACGAAQSVVDMDRRTWLALTDGHVDLPGRRVKAGEWFRVLRTLLDEVNTPPSQARTQAAALRRVWAQTGHPLRGGQTRWRSYEMLTWPVQQMMLEAAATAINLIESGTIPAPGVHCAPFRPVPAQPVFDDASTATPASTDTWAKVQIALAEAVAEAKRDPKSAAMLYHLCTLGRTDEAGINQVHTILADLGIPPSYRAHRLQANDFRDRTEEARMDQ